MASSVTLLLLLLSVGRLSFTIDFKLLRELFRYSIPLVLSGVAGTATLFIDRQLIKYLTPENAMAQLGLYGAVVKIAVIMTLYTQVYRQAAEPLFLSNIGRDEFKEANAKVMNYFLLGSMLIFLTITLFSDIFALFVGPAFREGVAILPFVLLANILSGVWLNLSFWYKHEKKTHFALWITLSGLFAVVVADVLLIPQWGYFGAAWARVAAESVMVVVSLVLNICYYPTPYPWARIAEYVAITALIYILNLGVGSLLEGEWLLRWMVNGVMLLGFVGYVIRREKLDVKRILMR